MEESDDDRIAYYLQIGALVLEGVDENGELIFSISETAKEIAPELWQSHKEYVDRTLLEMYQNGLIEVEYDENLEATIHMTEYAKKIAKEYGVLPEEDE